MSPEQHIVFVVCCNPYIDLVMRLSDGPKLSVTRICADDFGSALKSLLTLKYQAPIFNLAARCAGLHLKPSKCVLVITVVKLSNHLCQSIRSWLSINVPDFRTLLLLIQGNFWAGI